MMIIVIINHQLSESLHAKVVTAQRGDDDEDDDDDDHNRL